MFWNKKSCVHKYIRPTSLPVNNTHIELQPILDPLPDISDQLSPHIIQDILRASGVDFSKFKCYKCHKVNVIQQLRLLKYESKFIDIPIHKYNIPLQLTTNHIWFFQSGTLTKFPSLYFGISSMMACNQHIWPHWTVTCKLQTYPNYKGLASLQPGLLIKPCLLIWHFP